jgi:hypothetical protein
MDSEPTAPLRVAVLVDEQGMTTSPGQPGWVKVFSRDGQQWREVMQLPFTIAADLTLNDIRQQTLALLARLPGCRHFVARDIRGALLAWLDGNGLTLWQGSGRPEGFLSRIADEYPPAPPPATSRAVNVVDEGDGIYRLDLLAALEQGGAHTSKHLLVPLFAREDFKCIEIHCDHVPKWFSALDARQFVWHSVRRADGTLNLLVRRVS